MRPQRVNSPAWLRCADKVVQLNEPQERHHLPNRMARLDTSDGDDNLMQRQPTSFGMIARHLALPVLAGEGTGDHGQKGHWKPHWEGAAPWQGPWNHPPHRVCMHGSSAFDLCARTNRLLG